MSTFTHPRTVLTRAAATTGVLAAGAAEAGGQHSLLIAVIAGAFVVAGSIAGPIVTAWIQARRHPATDHYAELAKEQAQLVEHLIGELERRDDTIRTLTRRRRA